MFPLNLNQHGILNFRTVRGNTTIEAILGLSANVFVSWCADSSVRMQQFLEENASMRELHMVRASLVHHELCSVQAADFERILCAAGGNPHLQVFSFPGMDVIHADSIESLLNSTSIRTEPLYASARVYVGSARQRICSESHH
jgi:hypothetical protein